MNVRLYFDELRRTCEGLLEYWERTLPLASLKSEAKNIARNISEYSRFKGLAELLGELPSNIRRLLRTSTSLLPRSNVMSRSMRWTNSSLRIRKLNDFTGLEQTNCVDRVEKAMVPWFTQNAMEICRRCRERFRERMRSKYQRPGSTRRYQLGRKTLEHEFGKSMRYRSIRELVEGDSGLVFKDLKPIWLMSPLSVADTLPLDTNFVDVIIL